MLTARRSVGCTYYHVSMKSLLRLVGEQNINIYRCQRKKESEYLFCNSFDHRAVAIDLSIEKFTLTQIFSKKASVSSA